MNGGANDYFVIMFFLSISVCGLLYLSKAGYSLPEAPQNEDDEDKVD